jgi:ribosomal protein S18 acetylase RimI-like enzyme
MQIELEFVEGNSRARALYEKMGFRITGMKPNAIQLKDGTLLNEYSMIREIKR